MTFDYDKAAEATLKLDEKFDELGGGVPGARVMGVVSWAGEAVGGTCPRCPVGGAHQTLPFIIAVIRIDELMQTGVFGYLRPESAVWHAAGKALGEAWEPRRPTPAQGPARFHLATQGQPPKSQWLSAPSRWRWRSAPRPPVPAAAPTRPA
jgi:hypothetical protein